MENEMETVVIYGFCRLSTPVVPLRFRESRYLSSTLLGFRDLGNLGTPVVPFSPFYLRVSALKLNIWKKGTLLIKGLLGNLGPSRSRVKVFLVSYSPKNQPTL